MDSSVSVSGSALGIDRLPTRLALSTIRFYQRFLSPVKGFRCSHAVLYGGPSCSHAVLATIREKGVFQAIPLIRKRFAECRRAHLAIEDGALLAQRDVLDGLLNGFQPVFAHGPQETWECGCCG